MSTLNGLLIAFSITGAYFVCDMLVNWIRVIACIHHNEVRTDKIRHAYERPVNASIDRIVPIVTDRPVSNQEHCDLCFGCLSGRGCDNVTEIRIMSGESERPIKTYCSNCQGSCVHETRYDDEDD